MILVNNPGNDDTVFAPLRHADWNGCTIADLVFPFFLFVIGCAITFSLDPRRRSGKNRSLLYRGILRRSLLLLALGIFLNGFPLFDWSEMRFPGVLQRIACCYLFASIAATTLSTRAIAAVWSAILLGYWLMLSFVPVPGTQITGYAPTVNLAAFIDDYFLHGHLLREGWDPEGILSTLPAIATTLTGVLAGHWIRRAGDTTQRVSGLLAAGVTGVAVGLLAVPWCPINKNLWTSSYVLFTGGIALCTLSACYWLIDVKGWRRWSLPFVVYGTNPIVAYVFSSLIAKELLLWRVKSPDGSTLDLQRHLYESFFLSWSSGAYASLLYACAYVLFWLGVAALLYRRGVLIKI